MITALRFTKGLGAVTNLSDNNPWGIWIGFDLLCGVALAAGGYTTSAACYVFGLKRYHSAVRPAILTAFLGYSLVVFALHLRRGPALAAALSVLRAIRPHLGALRSGPVRHALPERPLHRVDAGRLGMAGLHGKIRNIIVKMTLALTIFGVILSTMHQSSLGALYLIAPSKLHPLWYSSYLPVFFFVSSIAAGLSMVIFEGTLSHRYLHDKMDATYLRGARRRDLGLRQGRRPGAGGLLSDQGRGPHHGQQLALPR